MKKILALTIVLIIAISLLAGCSSSSSYSRSAGECMWCDGVGYSRYKDASGHYVNKTCSHCHGTGRQ